LFALAARGEPSVALVLQHDRVIPLIHTFIAEDNDGVEVGATDVNGIDLTCSDLLESKQRKASL
jgi:hypothetical protein